MARPIDSTDAKRLIEKHRSLMERLAAAEASLDALRDDVLKTSDALVAKEVLRILKEVPVDELNRDKRGIRIKALHEHGYHTLADIAPASVHSIASIHGISEDRAYEIKRLVNEIVSTTRQGAKIRLSEDNKTAEATKVVSAISKFRNSEPHIIECRKLLRNAKDNIEYGIEDLLPATGGIKWFSPPVPKRKRRLRHMKCFQP